jgi:hypothetical protein
MAKLNGRDILLVGLKGDKGENAEVDKTLTKENEAADAKVVGDALNNKLDKVTSPDTVDRVYAIDTNGDQVVKTVTTTPLQDTIPKYTENGTIQSNAPQDIYDCANKEYVDTVAGVKADAQATMDAINSKLDKFTVQGNAGDKVYVARYDGIQTTTFIGARPGYIARYNGSAENNTAPAASCSLIVSTPQSDYAAANKKYVDDVADTKLDKKPAAGGNVCLYFVDPSGNGVLQTGSTPGSCVDGNIPRFLGNSSGSYEPATGRLIQRDPIQPYQVANKHYVDNQSTYYYHSLILQIENASLFQMEYILELNIVTRQSTAITMEDLMTKNFTAVSSKGMKYTNNQVSETKYNEFFRIYDGGSNINYGGWSISTSGKNTRIIDEINEIK